MYARMYASVYATPTEVAAKSKAVKAIKAKAAKAVKTNATRAVKPRL